MKSVFIALLTATSVAAGSLRVKPEVVACPKKEGAEQGRVLDCKKVTMDTNVQGEGEADQRFGI